MSKTRNQLYLYGYAGFLHGRGYRLGRGLLQWADRPHAHRDAKHLVHHVLRRAFRQAIRPRVQRHGRLHPGTIGATGDTRRPGGTRGLAAIGAHQLMPLDIIGNSVYLVYAEL